MQIQANSLSFFFGRTEGKEMRSTSRLKWPTTTKEYVEHVATCHGRCRDCGVPRTERLMRETYCQTCLMDYPVCGACLEVEDVRNVYVDQWYNCKCCRKASSDDGDLTLLLFCWPKSVCTSCRDGSWNNAKRHQCNTCGNDTVVLCDRCDPTPPSVGRCCVRGAVLNEKNERPLLHQCMACQKMWEEDDYRRMIIPKALSHSGQMMGQSLKTSE